MALDELLVAGGLLWAASAPKHAERGWLAAAWGIYCGFVVALLIPTVDHLLAGPPKPSAGFYAGVLAAMLIVGVWALLRAMALIQAPPPPR